MGKFVLNPLNLNYGDKMSKLQYPKGFEKIECPAEKTITLIGNKWTLLIIKELMWADRPLRYNELEKALKKISSKTLSTKLRNMVNYGIIEKNIIDDAPIKVEYSLTEKGRDLYNVKEHMAAWSERWHTVDLIQTD
jgi:DNA-binding HxlR family transcriptional regulator